MGSQFVRLFSTDSASEFDRRRFEILSGGELRAGGDARERASVPLAPLQRRLGIDHPGALDSFGRGERGDSRNGDGWRECIELVLVEELFTTRCEHARRGGQFSG